MLVLSSDWLVIKWEQNLLLVNNLSQTRSDRYKEIHKLASGSLCVLHTEGQPLRQLVLVQPQTRWSPRDPHVTSCPASVTNRLCFIRSHCGKEQCPSNCFIQGPGCVLSKRICFGIYKDKISAIYVSVLHRQLPQRELMLPGAARPPSWLRGRHLSRS